MQEWQSSGIACVSAVHRGANIRPSSLDDESSAQEDECESVFVLKPACSRLQARASFNMESCITFFQQSHVTPHTSHLTPHTSHITPHTSHVTRHTSHVTRHTSHITRHTSHVTHYTSHVTRHTSRVTRSGSWFTLVSRNWHIAIGRVELSRIFAVTATKSQWMSRAREELWGRASRHVTSWLGGGAVAGDSRTSRWSSSSFSKPTAAHRSCCTVSQLHTRSEQTAGADTCTGRRLRLLASTRVETSKYRE
jgi:hypothetical protein